MNYNFCIWDKEERKKVDTENWKLYIGADMRVYEIYPVSSGVIAREDVSNRYELRVELGFQ